jgi:ABC-2 type transport system permease protein
MGVIVVLTIFSNLGLPLFDTIKPYLLTTHMIGWKGFFDDPVPYTSIGWSAFALLMYIIGLLGATIFVFNRKDIKS